MFIEFKRRAKTAINVLRGRPTVYRVTVQGTITAKAGLRVIETSLVGAYSRINVV